MSCQFPKVTKYIKRKKIPLIWARRTSRETLEVFGVVNTHRSTEDVDFELNMDFIRNPSYEVRSSSSYK